MTHNTQQLLSLVFFLTLFLQNTNSQTIDGKVFSQNGETIPYSTIYIQETIFGTTTNSDGEYEIQLDKEGSFTITFQAIGYEKQEQLIKINKNESKTLNIVLKKQVYQLKEVRVYSNNEDPAYTIMRKAISMAPYYLRQTSHYEADVYLKGSLILNKIPKLIKRQMDKEDTDFEIGRRYTSESMNNITFDEPDKYHHKVISSRSSFPTGDDNSTMGFVNSSFYQPQIDLVISPLSPQAFSHYKFQYIDFFREGELYINKIKIIPKRKSQQLVEGIIFIVEDLWCIHSIDVKNDNFYGDTRIKQIFSQVSENVWLPISHHFNIDASVFGIKGNFKYISSVKYQNINLNKDLPTPNILKSGMENISQNQQINQQINENQKSKNQKKIDELLAKEEMNNREMYKLARLMRKETKNISRPDTSLEIKSENRYKIDEPEKDTLKADTAYWNKMRPMPLSNEELTTFAIKDSLKLAENNNSKNDSTKNSDNKKRSNKNSVIPKILNGNSFDLIKSKVKFEYKGLLKPKNIGFNPVLAIWLRQRFGLKIKTDSTHQLEINPTIKYSFGQEQFMWDTHWKYQYSPLKRGVIEMNIGQSSKDFYGYSAATSIINLGYNLMTKENFNKLYFQNHIELKNQIDIANGLVLSTNIAYKNIEELNNTSNFSFVKYNDNYKSNLPENNELNNSNIINQIEGSYSIGLRYTPKYYYRIDHGKKRMLRSPYPTLVLKYKQALRDIANSNSDFTYIDGNIHQKIRWGVFSSFNYLLGGGYFFNNDQMHFSSFKHFKSTEPEIELRDMNNSFALLQNYVASTNQWFGEAHIKYTSSLILLKRLPFFSNRLWTENIYVNFLTTPSFNNYSEIGYGLGQLLMIGEVSVFSSFKNFEPDRWGIKLIFKLKN